MTFYKESKIWNFHANDFVDHSVEEPHVYKHPPARKKPEKAPENNALVQKSSSGRTLKPARRM